MANYEGVIRRIDDLGRIVIPRDFRKKLNISDRIPLEMSIKGESIIIKKANPTLDASDVIHNAFLLIADNTCLSDADKESVLNKLSEAQKIIKDSNRRII